jgi:hypothetical protein
VKYTRVLTLLLALMVVHLRSQIYASNLIEVFYQVSLNITLTRLITKCHVAGWKTHTLQRTSTEQFLSGCECTSG